MLEVLIAGLVAIVVLVVLTLVASALSLTGGLTVPATVALAGLAGYLTYRRRTRE